MCQSCGMPLKSEELFGTNKDGSKKEEYCIYCYKDGMLVNPEITMNEMVEICVANMKMPKFLSKLMMKAYLPKLKRWKCTCTTECASGYNSECTCTANKCHCTKKN